MWPVGSVASRGSAICQSNLPGQPSGPRSQASKSLRDEPHVYTLVKNLALLSDALAPLDAAAPREATGHVSLRGGGGGGNPIRAPPFSKHRGGEQ